MGAVHLHHVETCFLRPNRRGDKIVYQTVHLGRCQHLGHRLFQIHGNRRRSRQLHDGPPAAVLELQADFSAVFMNCIHHFLKPRDHTVVTHGYLMVRRASILLNKCILGHNQPDSAPGPGRQIGGQLIGYRTVRIAEGRGHGGHNGSVF